MIILSSITRLIFLLVIRVSRFSYDFIGDMLLNLEYLSMTNEPLLGCHVSPAKLIEAFGTLKDIAYTER